MAHRTSGFRERCGRTPRKADCVPEIENGLRAGIECPRSRIEEPRDFSYFILFGRSAQRTQPPLCVTPASQAGYRGFAFPSPAPDCSRNSAGLQSSTLVAEAALAALQRSIHFILIRRAQRLWCADGSRDCSCAFGDETSGWRDEPAKYNRSEMPVSGDEKPKWSWWYLLFVIQFLAVVWPPFYNKIEPTFVGDSILLLVSAPVGGHRRRSHGDRLFRDDAASEVNRRTADRQAS